MLTIVAIGVGFFVLMMVIAIVIEKNKVRGTCPTCGAPVGFLKGVGACHDCGEGVRFVNDRYVPVEPGFVPDNPAFMVSMEKLKHPSKWQVIWPGRCCVCGQSAARQKKLTIKTIVGQAGPAFTPTNLTENTKYEVGYCNAHSDSIRFLFPPGFGNAKRNDQCALFIRSYDYYREFMQHNSQQGLRRAGGKVA